MDYQYLDSENRPAGPATSDEIRALAREGRIAADPMVRPIGASEWKILSSLSADVRHHPDGGSGAGAGVSAVTPSGESARRGLPVKGTLLGDVVSAAVRHVAAVLNPRLIEASLRWAREVGHHAVLVGAALVLVLTIVTAIRTNSFGIFLGGLGFVVALAVAQFAAMRFLGTIDTLIANTPSRVSSRAFLECVGLLAVLGAVALLVLGVQTAIRFESGAPLVPAVVTAVFWALIGAIALHPEMASVESGQGGAAEEAIGIIAFFFKAVLKTVPFFFGLLAVLGALAVLVGIFARRSELAYAVGEVVSVIPLPLPSPRDGGAGFAGAGAILIASLLPMIGYFLFLIASLPLELWRAVLALPGKLDALKRSAS